MTYKVAGLVDRDVVRRLPGELIRQLRPVVVYFVAMLAFAQNDGESVFLAVMIVGAAATAAAPAAICKNSRLRIVDMITPSKRAVELCRGRKLGMPINRYALACAAGSNPKLN